jgi:hypothetical protein
MRWVTSLVEMKVTHPPVLCMYAFTVAAQAELTATVSLSLVRRCMPSKQCALQVERPDGSSNADE